ncbi:MAG: class I SAM-dependent methyltransferase [Ferruginibacter sp.]
MILKKLAEKLPYLRYAAAYRKNSSFHRPGHFYSSVLDLDYIREIKDQLWATPKEMKGINLNVDYQVQLLKKMATAFSEMHFAKEKTASQRYYTNNPSFPEADALALALMMRHYKPKRIIEVGSGYSSMVMLDVNEQFFDNGIDITFVEPYPDMMLNKLLTNNDRNTVTVYEQKIQVVDPKIFLALEENDILFIDNSHVSKTGSDVNHVFFEVLPYIKKGVVVHIHDIFHQFIYPQAWVLEYRLNWNEIYTLRSFLMYNDTFQLEMFVNHLQKENAPMLETILPGMAEKTGTGGSCWMRKIK